MTEKEINYNEVTKEYEPCVVCLDAIMDAAYSDGFLTEDDEYIIIEDEDTVPYDDNLYYVNTAGGVYNEE